MGETGIGWKHSCAAVTAMPPALGRAVASRGIFLTGALVVAACGAGTPGTDRSTVRDSAGITIIENASPDDSAAYDWWHIEGQLVDIGAEGTGSGQDLFRVSSARRLADGRFVVADGGASELRFFDEAGLFLRSAGGRGDGPGEFQNIAWLTADPVDSLYVYDGRNGRMSVFGSDGGFARDFAVGKPGTLATAIGRFADGTFAGRETVILRPGADGPLPQGLQRPEVSIVRLDGAGQVVDTIGRFPGPERFINIASQGGQISSIEVVTPLLGRTPWHVALGDRLWSGTQDDPELRVFGMDGSLQEIVRTGRAPEPVTDRHRDALIGRRLENVPEDRRMDVRAGLESMAMSDFVPPYGMLLADRSGGVWVADYDDGLGPAGRWTVYSGEGHAVARVALPERFTPYDIGDDWILGIELDNLDIEHVRLYRLVRD